MFFEVDVEARDRMSQEAYDQGLTYEEWEDKLRKSLNDFIALKRGMGWSEKGFPGRLSFVMQYRGIECYPRRTSGTTKWHLVLRRTTLREQEQEARDCVVAFREELGDYAAFIQRDGEEVVRAIEAGNRMLGDVMKHSSEYDVWSAEVSGALDKYEDDLLARVDALRQSLAEALNSVRKVQNDLE